MNPIVLTTLTTAIRYGLSVLAGMAGYATSEGELNQVAGYTATAVLFAGSLLWSLYRTKKANAKLPSVPTQ